MLRMLRIVLWGHVLLTAVLDSSVKVDLICLPDGDSSSWWIGWLVGWLSGAPLTDAAPESSALQGIDSSPVTI